MKSPIADRSLIFIALILLALVLKELQSFLIPLALAIMLTFLLLPLVRFSKEKRIPLPMALVGLLLLIFLFMGGFGFLIVQEAEQLTSNPLFTKEKIDEVIDYVNQEIEQFNLLDTGFDISKLKGAGEIGGTLASFISPIISALGNFFSMFFTVLLFLIFTIPSYQHFLVQLKKTLPPARYRKIKTSLLSVEKSIRDYLYTKSLVSLGTAIVSMIVLLSFGSRYVLILGVLLFILNFIPNIGSFIAVFIAVLAYVIQNGFGFSFIILLGLLILVQILFGNYIEPKLAGKKLNLSPIIILVSLFIWYYIWGILGMILAIPLTAIIKIILAHNPRTAIYAKFME